MKGEAKAAQKKKGIFTPIAELLASRFPDLKKKLRMADMDDNPVDFLEKTVSSTILISAGLLLLVYILLAERLDFLLRTDIVTFLLLVIAPLIVLPVGMFFYLMLYPEASIMRRQREMDYEIVFAGRHIAIALKSGMPLFDTFAGAATGYGAVSKEFTKIVDQVMLGASVSQAIRDVVEYNPSKYFTRMLIQIANAVSSGADVGSSMENVLDQISKEQLISLKEYSQKLTPVVMFYMVFGIIIPTLGVVLTTVILSAIGGGFPPIILPIVFVIVALIQFLFLGFIESSRPKYLI
ncbi:MAG: type II secretion system F family protein [Candidatus ainarchaeum sp.]|nr:type II secretion system F family protein [Candidatus ainarchaeum sp.]